MVNDTRQEKPFSEQCIDEITKIEIQECHTAIRTYIDKRSQLVVFFGTGNLTLLGLSIVNHNSLFLIAGGGCLLFFIIVDSLLRSHLTAYLFTGLNIEKKYGRELGLIKCEILTHYYGLEFSEHLNKLSDVKDPIQLSVAFQKFTRNPFKFRGGPIYIILIGGIVEIILGIVFKCLFNWSLF